MLPNASRYVSIKFSDKCLKIINNKEILNGIKGSAKMQKGNPQFKYQSLIYNVQRNSDIDDRGMKKRWNNKLFPSLNVIIGKTSTYESKGVLRYYHY